MATTLPPPSASPEPHAGTLTPSSPRPGGPPGPPAPGASAPTRRQLGVEAVIVLGLSYGAFGISSSLDLIKSLVATPVPLAKQVTTLYAPVDSHAWLDVAYQLLGVATELVPVVLVGYLLVRSGESMATLGVDRRQPAADARWGVGLAVLVGVVGLGFRLAANALGTNLELVIGGSAHHWWTIGVLLAQSAGTAVGEEVIVTAFLLHRLRQMRWGDGRSLTASALLRGSYHLYQGFGGGLANLALGLVFGRLFQRQGRVVPLVIAHFLIDAVSTVGYVELHGRLGWLH